MNIVKLECSEYTLDWYRDKEIEIDVDKYVFFEVEYRGGDAAWYLQGHRYIESTKKWVVDDFDYHMCRTYEIAKFIAKANKIKDKNGFARNRVSRFNNLHYSSDFYKKLSDLLDLVKEYEEVKNAN